MSIALWVMTIKNKRIVRKIPQKYQVTRTDWQTYRKTNARSVNRFYILVLNYNDFDQSRNKNVLEENKTLLHTDKQRGIIERRVKYINVFNIYLYDQKSSKKWQKKAFELSISLIITYIRSACWYPTSWLWSLII